MSEASEQIFYILPLTNMNLFPHTTKPLNIFESRYIEMVNKSVEEGIPIAMCFVPEGSHEIRPIAGYAIPQIVERRLDGTLLVFMACKGRASLDLNSIQTDGLISSMKGKPLVEEHQIEDSLRPQYLLLSEVLVRWLVRHVTDVEQRDLFINNLTGPKEVVGAFAAYLIYDYDLQYEVIEIPLLNDQIKFLYRLLESGKLTNV